MLVLLQTLSYRTEHSLKLCAARSSESSGRTIMIMISVGNKITWTLAPPAIKMAEMYICMSDFRANAAVIIYRI